MSKKANKGGSKKGNPNFCTGPYMVAIGFGVLIFAIYAAVFAAPSSGGKPGSKPSSGGAPIARMEEQLETMYQKMQNIAAGGKSPVFAKIKAMADTVADVLARARAAETDDERRNILEQGLASKSDMLAALSDQATQLKAQDEADRQGNAPVSVDGSGAVAKLTKETFPAFLAQNQRSMVEFYAPWCGHCKKLAPEYERCAKEFSGRAGFAAVDATSEEQLARIYEVTGYPTLKWFVRGRPIDYEGPRSAEHISKWVEERLKPAYAEVDPSDDLAAALEQSDSSEVAICAGAGEKGSEVHQIFEAAAEELRGKLVFVWATGGTESIAFHRKGASPQACKSEAAGAGCASAEEVVAWLEDALAELEFGDAGK